MNTPISALPVRADATQLENVKPRQSTEPAGRRDAAGGPVEYEPEYEYEQEQKHATQPRGPATSPKSASSVQPGSDFIFTRGDRSYRVRGLEKNHSSMQLVVNILATRAGLVHLDTLDLVKARSRSSFIRAAASELFVDEQVIKKDVGQLLLALEDLQAQQIEAATQKKLRVPEMTDEDRQAALELLRDPDLLTRIGRDLEQCGSVGEETNKLAAYLAAVSRKLPKPLAVIIQSSSAAGKTSLMDALLALMPPEEQLRFSSLTGQALCYLEGEDLQHKILALAEEEGAAEAVYALKLIQSEGELRQATVGKNANGRMATQQYHVQGPVQLFLTTTSLEIDEELVNRCLVLSVDESREQTRAIHDRQRLAETREGKLAARAAEKIRHLHHNAQRLLEPLEVDNPYAPRLTFAHDKTRLRRDHAKYLALINAVALLHQYQRPVLTEEAPPGPSHPVEPAQRIVTRRVSEGVAGTNVPRPCASSAPVRPVGYINVTPTDIAIANRIAAEVLGRTLDELPSQTRRCLMLVYDYVTTRCRAQQIERIDFRFTRRELRAAIGWSDFQLRQHLGKLVELEYVLVHRGRRGRQFVYELLYDGQGQSGEPFLIGLIDPATLDE